VTFRDIQARNKALEILGTTPLKSLFGKKLVPKELRLLETGIYKAAPAMDPSTILWENLGTP
jgi:hypothetical protein